MSLGSGIRDPGSGINLFRIPDPGSRGQKAPNPGSRIRIRNTGIWIQDFYLLGTESVPVKRLFSFIRIQIGIHTKMSWIRNTANRYRTGYVSVFDYGTIAGLAAKP